MTTIKKLPSGAPYYGPEKVIRWKCYSGHAYHPTFDKAKQCDERLAHQRQMLTEILARYKNEAKDAE